MSSSPDPPAPDDLPQYLVDGLQRQSPERLDAVINYAKAIKAVKQHARDTEAAKKRADAQSKLAEYAEELADREDIPDSPEAVDDVPSNAYLTIKTIDGRDYVYWQWRDDAESWGNKYVAPVVPQN